MATRAQIAGDCVAIGWKALLVDQHPRPPAVRKMKSCQQLMEIDRGRLADRDVVGFRTQQGREQCRGAAGHREPRLRSVGPAENRSVPPVVERLPQRGFRRPAQQAERVPVEIDDARRLCELDRVRSKRIDAIEFVKGFNHGSILLAVLPGPHRARPGFDPVWSPSLNTWVPLTKTCFTPTAYWCGLS
jgi:ribosomal protein L15